MCAIGETYLVPSGPEFHLYVVVTEEDDDGMHILVGVSSIDDEIPHDKTCLFNGGEHDFIKHPSYATYEFAIQRHKNFVDDRVKRKIYKKHKNASSDLVAKIGDGIKKSPFAKRAIKDGYDRCLRAAIKRQKATANPAAVDTESG